MRPLEKTELEEPLFLNTSRCRVWPYVVETIIVGASVSAFLWYRFLTAPLPPEVSDESSFIGNVIVWTLVIVSVCTCGVGGALIGWLISYLIRIFLPISRTNRDP